MASILWNDKPNENADIIAKAVSEGKVRSFGPKVRTMTEAKVRQACQGTYRASGAERAKMRRIAKMDV